MPSYNVYISSTFRDLIPYRKVVMESLHKVRNFQVIGMEYYTAENTQPINRCLQDVADCNIYILILANRYGYVMPGYDKSITHQEYIKARSLGKAILVFLADSRDSRFPFDIDEPDQPSSLEKQEKLKNLKQALGEAFLLPAEGFRSKYLLALQVMEALVRHPRIDFDGDFPEERKIFCDRANQVYDFYDLIRRKQPFNVFLIQGNELDLGQSLVERLSKYYLSSAEPTMISYHEFIQDPSYANFRRRLINELCFKLFPNESDPPIDPLGLLTALKVNEVNVFSLLSSISDAVQWQTGYLFLDKILAEFAQASAILGDVRVFWFIVIDVPDALQHQIQSVDVLKAPALTMLQRDDIKSWISTYIDSNAGTILQLLNLCFPNIPDPPVKFDMYLAQQQLQKFIRRLNHRKKKDDQALLDIFP